MAKIQLNEEAAAGVYLQLSSSALELKVSKMSFLEDLESQSKSIDAFKEQATGLRRLLVSYRELLAHDVKSLNDACVSLVSADKLSAAGLSGKTGPSTTRVHVSEGSSSGGGGAR